MYFVIKLTKQLRHSENTIVLIERPQIVRCCLHYCYFVPFYMLHLRLEVNTLIKVWPTDFSDCFVLLDPLYNPVILYAKDKVYFFGKCWTRLNSVRCIQEMFGCKKFGFCVASCPVWKDKIRDRVKCFGLKSRGAYLVSALSSLVFLPSREARCCSRASRRLLGA